MRKLRIVLLLTLIPLAPKIVPHVARGMSTVDGVWSEYALPNHSRQLRTATEAVTDLHTPLGIPEPGDWLDTVVEPGQSFSQYALSDPVTRTEQRNRIYVLPLGTFTETQRQIVERSTEFMELYFSCPVVLLPEVGDEVVLAEARRIHPRTNEEQFHSTWILNEILEPQLPEDATAFIALTATDLWPGKNYNFVFGQASLVYRVGVWSMARFGDPDAGAAEFTECLRRTLATATHETGHMFSMKHCVYFECNMAGSGSLEEADKHPLYLCPECLAKLHFATRPNPEQRLLRLGEFCRQHGLEKEAVYYERAMKLLRP